MNRKELRLQTLEKIYNNDKEEVEKLKTICEEAINEAVAKCFFWCRVDVSGYHYNSLAYLDYTFKDNGISISTDIKQENQEEKQIILGDILIFWGDQ